MPQVCFFYQILSAHGQCFVFCDMYMTWTTAEEASVFCVTHDSTNILESFLYFFFCHILIGQNIILHTFLDI